MGGRVPGLGGRLERGKVSEMIERKTVKLGKRTFIVQVPGRSAAQHQGSQGVRGRQAL